MTCKDCLFNKVCHLVEHYGVDLTEDGVEYDCDQFLDRNKYAKVIHAEWLDGYGVHGGIKKYESIDCSNCGEYFKIESHDREYWKKRFKVCPFCGAVMDGGNEDG